MHWYYAENHESGRMIREFKEGIEKMRKRKRDLAVRIGGVIK